MQTPIKSTARFTAMPDDETLATTVAALEARGFGTEVVEDLDAAREAVLARIPHGSSVATNSSVTLEETGIAAAINDDGPYDSARKVLTLDRATRMREIKAIIIQPDWALGSVHAVTRDGTLVIASALGSQLAAYAWGAENVILIVGAQKKLVPDLAAAHERIHQHCLELENERTLGVYGRRSYIGKILEIHQDEPGRTHVVVIRQAVGF